MLREDVVSVFLLECAEFCCAFRVRCEIDCDSVADILWNVDFRAERSMLDVVDVVVEELVDVVLHLDDCGRVRSDDNRNVLLDSDSHDCVVSRRVVLDFKDGIGSGIDWLHTPI